MNLAERAVAELFPERDERRALLVTYSGRFSAYNANVKYTPTELRFSLSKDFRELSEEIRQGVIEHLLCKIYNKKKPSTNQDLYHSFMKHLSSVARIDEKDDYLLGRFTIINDAYFNGMMSEPNLKWGQRAFRKLGHYQYSTDTIVISSVFLTAKENNNVQALLDFVLYHEMLHKKHQYDHKKERAQHHTKTFREDERRWPEKNIEKKLSWFLAKKKIKRLLIGY